ncbi:MAG: hypothetical protein WBA57_06070 [Elainellaceae cyanobacterium]
MLYASILLHGVVFAIPGNPTPEEPTEEEVKEEEEAMVSLFAPTEEAAPDVLPETEPEPPPPEPEPEPQPKPAQQAPEPVPNPNPPTQAAAPADLAPEPEPEGEPAEDSDPVAAEEPPSEFNPLVPRQQFVSGLGNVGDNVTVRQGIVPRPNFYGEPQAFFTNTDDPNAYRYGIIDNSVQWFNDDAPAEVFEKLQTAYQGSGVNFTAIAGGYGGGPLYEVTTPEGQQFGFVNLAPGRGGASTIMIIWDLNPTLPANQQQFAGNANS